MRVGRPPPQARIVVPAESRESVIVFGPEGSVFAPRYENLERPLG